MEGVEAHFYVGDELVGVVPMVKSVTEIVKMVFEYFKLFFGSRIISSLFLGFVGRQSIYGNFTRVDTRFIRWNALLFVAVYQIVYTGHIGIAF